MVGKDLHSGPEARLQQLTTASAAKTMIELKRALTGASADKRPHRVWGSMLVTKMSYKIY
jgi:hypothetical protein